MSLLATYEERDIFGSTHDPVASDLAESFEELDCKIIDCGFLKPGRDHRIVKKFDELRIFIHSQVVRAFSDA